MLTKNTNLEADEIKKMLLEHNLRTDTIQKRVRELYAQMEKADSSVTDIGQISRSYIDITKSTHERDLSDLMQQHEKLEQQKALAIRSELSELASEKERLNRIWICAQKLEGPEFQIINELYILHRPYKEVLTNSEPSERTFNKLRRQALEQITAWYNSAYTNREISEGAWQSKPSKE